MCRLCMYVCSTANQRIESYWSQFRRNRGNWWINFFKDMTDMGLLDTSLEHHLSCIRFAFMPLLQKELDEVMRLWNNHRIRPVSNAESQSGIPDILYFTPELTHGADHGFPTNDMDLSLARTATTTSEAFGCSRFQLNEIGRVMNEKDLFVPSCVDTAKQLYVGLVEGIEERL